MSYMRQNSITNSHPTINVQGITLPNEPLTNFQLMAAANRIKIPNFRGVFLRNQLPKKPKRNECGILNLDDENGTHWVCWYKSSGCRLRGSNCNVFSKENGVSEKYYFDSYGLRPPEELLNYLKSPIYYNTERIQPPGTVCCGHYCLHVLKELSKGENLQNIVNKNVLTLRFTAPLLASSRPRLCLRCYA